MTADVSDDLMLDLTVQLVSAHVSNNSVSTADLPNLIKDVHTTLLYLGEEPEPEEEILTPAVPIKKSIQNEYIVCLEDGKKLKMLKRHLKTAYDMTPEEYRKRWGLASDYPMVAPAYAKQRSELAKNIGLGTKAKRG